jgi:hypothetical protein
MFGPTLPYIMVRNAKKTIGVLRVAEVMVGTHKCAEITMHSTCDDFECAVDFVAEMFMLNMSTAVDIWNMVDRVVRICLCKHVGHDKEIDVGMIKKIIMNKLRDELAVPTYFDNLERCSVQTCVVVLSREIALDYIRNAHYSRSSISEIFRCMNVNVSGAEEYLDGLDEMFSPSQKCVLRLLYGEGCTVHQAANMLGVSSDEVLTLQWQAMERLQQEWRFLKTGGAYQ